MESSGESKIETLNNQGVSLSNNRIQILMPKRFMTKEEARRHAAWLVVMSDVLTGESPEFGDILEAVQNT